MMFKGTLKFKLALWYSILLFIILITFVIVFNLIAIKYVQIEPPLGGPGMFGRNRVIREITYNERLLIEESRLNDIKNIRTLSIYSVIPFVLLSFVGGYLIADRNLKPLEKLKEEMERRNATDLHSEIEYIENGDEVSALIMSFNNMSRRLHLSFKSQREFVENASHELKTPLAIALANIDSALEDGKMSKREVDSILKTSKDSIKFMDSLTEDLLLLSSLNQNFKRERINICEVLNSSVSQAKKLDSEFQILVTCDDSYMIDGNSLLLQRSFSNIIENAIKYSNGDLIEIKVFSKDDTVSISFKDNGVGIKKEHRKRIFERFYRVERSRSRKSGGSGLGLSITSEIVRKHGGNIRVAGSEKGSQFILTLPLVHKE